MKTFIKISLLTVLSTMTLHTFAAEKTLTEELVVTAQKREQSVADVPIAITVITEDQINNSFSANVEGLQFLAPSLTFKKTNSAHNNVLIVRGIGTVSFSFGTEPSVAVVVDNIVMGRVGQAYADLYDTARIEVLKGPQGTLFGKNSSAGVVNITTVRPTEDFSGYVKTQYFSDDEYRGTFKINGKITDKVNASATLFKGKFDGFLFNNATNSKTNGYDRSGARVMVDFKLQQDLNVLTIFETYNSNDNCCVDVPGALVKENANLAATQAYLRLFYSIPTPGVNAAVGTTATIDGLNGKYKLKGADTESILQGVTTDKTNTTAFSVQLNKSYKDGNLISITSGRKWDHEEFRDEDLTAQDKLLLPGTAFQQSKGPEKWSQYSQEIRFDGKDDKLNYNVGLYIWHQNVGYNFTRWAAACPSPLTATSGTPPVTAVACLLVNPADVLSNAQAQNQPPYAFNPGSGTSYAQLLQVASATGYIKALFENKALFFNIDAEVYEDFRLIVGARYTNDYVSYKHRRNNELGFAGAPGVAGTTDANEATISDRTTEENLSGKFGLQGKIDNTTIYASYSSGYKGPGWNLYYNFNSVNDVRPIAAELSDALEFGVKVATDDALITFALYETTVRNYHANSFISINNSLVTTLTNAGKIRSEGVELDFIYKPTSEFTLTGGFNSGKAEFVKFNCSGQRDIARCTDHKGLPIPYAADLKANIGFDVSVPVDGKDVFTFNATYSFVSEQLGDMPALNVNSSRKSERADGKFCADNTATCLTYVKHPTIKYSTASGTAAAQNLISVGDAGDLIGIPKGFYIPAYDIVNVSFGYSMDDDAYKVAFIIKNLLDNRFYTGYTGTATGNWAYRYQLSRESQRYYGVDFTVKF
ncbi:MAG: TonB-dependent receptor [Methylacidiphilales bacterium]|nr:TonB-dependent receptor [Candidatus Methylacidiphilales bacterium]